MDSGVAARSHAPVNAHAFQAFRQSHHSEVGPPQRLSETPDPVIRAALNPSDCISLALKPSKTPGIMSISGAVTSALSRTRRSNFEQHSKFLDRLSRALENWRHLGCDSLGSDRWF